MTAKVCVKVPEACHGHVKVTVEQMGPSGEWEPLSSTDLRFGHKPYSHYLSSKKRFIIEEISQCPTETKSETPSKTP